MDAFEAAARRSRERSPKRQKYLDQRKIKDDSTENYEKLAQDTLTRLDLHEELFNELNERHRLKARAEVLLAHAENLVETMKQQPDTDLIAQKRLFAQRRVSVAYLQRLVEEGGEHADRIARLNKALSAYGKCDLAKRSFTRGTAPPTAEYEEVAEPKLVSAKKKLSPKPEDNSYTYTRGKQYNEGSAVSPVGSQEVANSKLVSAKMKARPKQPLDPPPEHLVRRNKITQDDLYKTSSGSGSSLPKQPRECPPEHLLCSAGNLGCYDEVKQWKDRCGKQGGAYSP